MFILNETTLELDLIPILYVGIAIPRMNLVKQQIQSFWEVHFCKCSICNEDILWGHHFSDDNRANEFRDVAESEFSTGGNTNVDFWQHQPAK